MSYKVVDLFCGAGGFSKGFDKNPAFFVTSGVDVNETAIDTFTQTHEGDGVTADIKETDPFEVLPDSSHTPTVVIGSPPCQGFSDARGSRYIDDERNGLVFEFIRWVDLLSPEIFVMENVLGMRTISDDFIDAIQREFSDCGYKDTTVLTVTASEYGVPQKRKRLFIIGIKDTNSIESDITIPPCSPPTVEQALQDLPEVVDDLHTRIEVSQSEDAESEYAKVVRDSDSTTHHVAKEPSETGLHILKQLQPGEMYRSNRFGDRYRGVWDLFEDEFTETQRDILYFIAKHRSRKEYRIKGKTVGPVDVELIYPELSQEPTSIDTEIKSLLDDGWIRDDTVDGRYGIDINTKSGIRPRYMRLTPDEPANTILTTDFTPREKAHPFKNRGLSLREGARIQSFPDSFNFVGSFSEVADQIGNAVPPVLAYQLSKGLQEELQSCDD